MRLTGGDMKGRRVRARGLGTSGRHGALRATSSKVRASVFNIIGQGLDGCSFADLYAGAGTVGMEAMSRGAGPVYFVEVDTRRARELTDALDGCGCREKAVIRHTDVLDFIRQAVGLGLDYVFLDPPYKMRELQRVMPALGQGGALAPDAIVIAEHEKGLALAEAYGVLVKHKTYRYGDTWLTTYRRSA